MALLLSVLVLTILIAIVTQMTITAAHNKSISATAIADLQNTYGAKAGYQHAVLHLQADRERGETLDSLHEKWATPFSLTLGSQESTTVWVRIQDAERKFNLSLAVNEGGERVPAMEERFHRLVRGLGIADDVAERILDYVDKDTKGEYEAGARNERPFNLEELLRIPGIPREALYGDEETHQRGLVEFLTLWPSSGEDAGKANLNTAPVEILASLHDKLTEALAAKIAAYREQKSEGGGETEFKAPEDLKKVEGITEEIYQDVAPMITVKSATFEIRSRSLSGPVEKEWLFVVARKDDKVEPVASMMVNDFVWVKPPEE